MGSFDGEVFELADVTFTILDESIFGTNDGMGEVIYNVSVHPLLVPGDPTAGPGIATVTAQQTFTAIGGGINSVTTPMTAVVTEPFFIVWQFVSFTNTDPAAAPQVISPGWDGVARPLGRQFVANAGADFIDFTDFFAAGDTGWVDVVVSGDFVLGTVPLPPAPVVPTINVYGMLLMAVLLLMGGALVSRRRS